MAMMKNPTHKTQGCKRVVKNVSILTTFGLSALSEEIAHSIQPNEPIAFFNNPERKVWAQVVTVTTLPDNFDNPKVVNGLSL